MTVRYRRADDDEWERQKEDAPPRYAFTRDQLIDVLTRLKVYPVGPPLAQPSVVVAFAMLADAIIEALDADTEPGREPARRRRGQAPAGRG